MHSELRRTTCNRDCPDACGIVATVADGRVVDLRGDPEHPVTRGFLCFRTSRFLERQYAPDRLTGPMLRAGNAFVPIGLDEALDLAAERLLRIRAESGPAAIFHYRSGGSLGLLKAMADRFFEHFGPCTAKVGDICSGAGETAQELDFGVADSNDLFDLENSKHIVLWGKNPFASNVHLVPVLKAAQRRGARLWLIDPVHHKTATMVDRYLQPRPGGDLDLALAVGQTLFAKGAIDPDAATRCAGVEEYTALVAGRSLAQLARAADVSEAEIAALAAAFADGPTAILVGWGMQRRRCGGATVRALDAISALSGNLFRSGGGCSFYFKRRKAFANDALATGAAVRRVREPLLGEDVLAAKDPPIRAMWVTAGNPVSMLPASARVAEAIDRTEFVVVVDSFLTDTARRADLVLPCPTLLEDDDLVGAYGHHWLSEVRPVVPPPPGVPQEADLFAALARRVGLERAFADDIEAWKRRLLAPVAAGGASLDDLRRHGAVRNPDAPNVLFAEGRVATADGRVQLIGELPKRFRLPTGYPLWLFSNSTEKSQASQWAGKGLGDSTWVRVHPDAAPGARAGDLVWVESPHGRLRARLEFDEMQRRDVAIVPKGGHFDRGHSANALIEAVPTDLGLGAAYLDCGVRLVRGA
ncbi:MAG: molybdopterin-dependent oxidoreductase [Planctomycetota bacterium]